MTQFLQSEPASVPDAPAEKRDLQVLLREINDVRSRIAAGEVVPPEDLRNAIDCLAELRALRAGKSPGKTKEQRTTKAKEAKQAIEDLF